MSMENPDYRDRIKGLFVYLPIPIPTLPKNHHLPPSPKQDMNYLSNKKKDIKQEKNVQPQKMKREFSSRDRKGTTFTGTPLDDVQCTATKSPASSTLSVGTKPTLGGTRISRSTHSTTTPPNSLSIQAETQARSQTLGRHPADRLISDSSCRSLPQRGAQHLRQPSSTLSEGRTMHDILLAPEPHAGRLPIGWTTQ